MILSRRASLGFADLWVSNYESRPTGYLPVSVRAGEWAKMPDLRLWRWVSLYLSYKSILLKSMASITFDRKSQLPFNPTYVLGLPNLRG